MARCSEARRDSGFTLTESAVRAASALALREAPSTAVGLLRPH